MDWCGNIKWGLVRSQYPKLAAITSRNCMSTTYHAVEAGALVGERGAADLALACTTTVEPASGTHVTVGNRHEAPRLSP
jgi:hypothetical protein